MLKRQLWLRLSLFSLLILLGCRKKQPEPIEPPDPTCENGSCCVQGGNFTLYKRLKGEPVFYGGLGVILFKEAPVINFGTPYYGFPVCAVTAKYLPKNIPVSDPPREQITEYKYRVWGRLYRYEGITDFGGNPVHYVAVDSLKEVK